MRADNRSAFIRTARLQPLIDFVTRHVPDVADTKFVFEDMKSPEAGTGGRTMSIAGVTVVLIGLGRVRRKLGYPMVNHHSMPEVDAVTGGGMVFYSWEEEVVFTMLHEARHVRQFARRVLIADHELIESEIDAERFAMRLFKRYRREVAEANDVPMAA